MSDEGRSTAPEDIMARWQAGRPEREAEWERAVAEAKRVADAERERAWKWWWQSAAPLRYRDADMVRVDVPQLTEWLGDVMATTNTAPPWLMLVGPTGRGKTYAAWALVRALADLWRGDERDPFRLCAFSTADLLGRLRDIRACEDLHEALAGCMVLLLDDLVTEGGLTSWEAQQIDRIINARYERDRLVIVTSNLPPAELGRAVGERVAGRFAEACVVVPFTGVDRRRDGTSAP